MQRCPEYEFCLSSSPALSRLGLAYGPWIKVTLAEPSSSIVVRSEHQYNKRERHRLALRKHIYEMSADQCESKSRTRRSKYPLLFDAALLNDFRQRIPRHVADDLKALLNVKFTDVDTFELALERCLAPIDFKRFGEYIVGQVFSPLDCYQIKETDQFGHYVGFIDLRPNSPKSPLAMGLLALPRKFRHNDSTFIITGNYGPLFGGPGFPCTVYSMHDPDSGGAHCAQACIIMALGLLADRGARLNGSYTLTYLGMRPKAIALKPGTSESTDSVHLGNVSETDGTRYSFHVKGLTPLQISRLLNKRGVSSSLLKLAYDTDSEKLAQRLIEAYIYARFPVILAVDPHAWWPWKKPKTKKKIGHAVTVVGIRRLPGEGDEIALITHDPGFKPFYERPFRECIDACVKYDDRKIMGIQAIFVAHESVKKHAYVCVRALENSPTDNAIIHKYLYSDGDPTLDYQIGLIVRDNLAETFYSRSAIPNRKHVKRLQQYLEQRLPRVRYWGIAALKNLKLQWVWLFDAKNYTPMSPVPWNARLRFVGQQVEVDVASGTSVTTERVDFS
ncbi:MAG: hypothetical protein IID46_10210 [Planctomycetes bacterium]|nr:hypothetical protein [Planctomycetota bacterium]